MQVSTQTTEKGVWDTLKARFIDEERVKDARLQTLKNEFDAMRMREDESIDSYSGKLAGMSTRYNGLGGMLTDAALVKKIFDTVPEKFINVVVGIEQFLDLKKVTFTEVVGRLKTFEERTRRGGGSARSDTGQVLMTQAEWEAQQNQATSEGSGKFRSHDGGGRGRGRGRGGGRGRRGGSGDRGKEQVDGGQRDKSHTSVSSVTGMDTMPTVASGRRRRMMKPIM
jgi:hypothetical protein